LDFYFLIRCFKDFFELKLSLNDNVMIKNHSFLLMSTNFLQKCYNILFSISNIIEAFYKSETTTEFRRKWNILKTNKCIENSAINVSKFENYINNEHIISSNFLIKIKYYDKL